MARQSGRILDDDEEIDFASKVLDVCGIDIEDYFFDERVLTSENLSRNFSVIRRMVKNRPFEQAPYFVIGYFVIVTGIEMPNDLRMDILNRAKPNQNERVDIERMIYLRDFYYKVQNYESSSKFHPIHLTYFDGDQDLYTAHRDRVVIGVNEFQKLCKSGEIYSKAHLVLQGWNLSKIPRETFQIKRLRSLSLKFNNISEIPEDILKLKSLKTLSLDYNNILRFPEVLTNLPSLELLSMDNNNISTLPPSVKNFKILRNLFIRKNNINELPQSLANFPFNIIISY
ncbi:MAG: leucine-rich repeat domain-containing protein [Candidatus Thorarchaeota archaeon]